MKTIIAIDETSFYHPKLMEDILRLDEIEIVGVLLITKITKKYSLLEKVKNNLMSFKICEVVGFCKHIFNNYKKVRTVLEKNQVSYLKINNDINDSVILEWVRNKKPDLIFSSCTLIFKKELLKIPKFGCFNRHSSCLPSYGGLWPIFHAFINQEKNIGVTIHKMSEDIDAGEIVAQTSYPLDFNKSMHQLYLESFSYTLPLFSEFLAELKFDKLVPLDFQTKKSYHSFPSPEEFNRFHDLGGKII